MRRAGTGGAAWRGGHRPPLAGRVGRAGGTSGSARWARAGIWVVSRHFGEFPEALRPEIARNRLLSLRSLTATWANAGSTLDVGLASLGKLAKMDMKQEMTGIALLASALIAASRPAR